MYELCLIVMSLVKNEVEGGVLYHCTYTILHTVAPNVIPKGEASRVILNAEKFAASFNGRFGADDPWDTEEATSWIARIGMATIVRRKLLYCTVQVQL